MTEAIQQSVEFRIAPAVLYEMYMDSKKHSQATGAPAKLGRRAGAAFTAFGGELLGKNLLIVPKKMIVQSWRAAHWKKSDPDSILVLTFSKTKSGGRVDLVHVNVPEHDHQGRHPRLGNLLLETLARLSCAWVSPGQPLRGRSLFTVPPPHSPAAPGAAWPLSPCCSSAWRW